MVQASDHRDSPTDASMWTLGQTQDMLEGFIHSIWPGNASESPQEELKDMEIRLLDE